MYVNICEFRENRFAESSEDLDRFLSSLLFGNRVAFPCYSLA